ncbi:MAG: hypothetical protein LBO06_02785 [Bacteroidales bacterium]|jgi:hypothetical protein|nr:hypothetical protein [Bacteroidales bacterium]
MKTPVDMYYRFTWDTEPTEEQLQVIMSEVCEQAKQENEKNLQAIQDDIREEIKRLQTLDSL